MIRSRHEGERSLRASLLELYACRRSFGRLCSRIEKLFWRLGVSTLVDDKKVEPIGVEVTATALTVELSDGRTISAPTEWFPRLAHGTPKEWANFQLSYGGVHWPDLNEDISIEALLRGEKSGESLDSLKRWLAFRARGEKEPILEFPIDARLSHKLQKAGVLKPQRPARRGGQRAKARQA